MSHFTDFDRNVTFSKQYDEHSFIGKWLDESIWCDKEYIKLEKS